MIHWLLAQLKLQLPGDEAWRRDTTRLLRISLLTNLVVSSAALLGALLFRVGDWRFLAINSSIGVAVAAGLWLLLLRGYPRLAAVGTVAAYMLIMLFAAYQGAGVFSLSYGLYVLVVIASALFLPRQAAFWVAGIGSLAGLVIGMLHRLDSVPNQDILPPEPAVWLTMSAYFFVVAVMLNMALRQIERSLQQAQQSLAERLRAEEEILRLNEVRYRALFERTNDAVFIISLDNKHIAANGRAVALLGYSVEELLELKHTRDIIIPSEYEESREKFTALLAGEAVPVYERHFIRKDGTILAVEIDAALVRDDEGCPLHIQSIARDITERKKTEEEIYRLNQTLEQRVAQRTAELGAAVKEMENLSYHISHSLRSPLRAINAFATILQQEYHISLDANGLEHLGKIESNTRLMGQMIDELLLFLRLGRMTIVKHRIDPAAVVQQVLERLLPAYEGHPIKLVLGELPGCRADEALLAEVYYQLISNALKFSSRQPQPVIEVAYTSQDGGAYFVRDNGVGFDMRFAGKLFGVFQRLVLPEEFEGTGIGLAIAQRIVSRHGGRIWTEAEAGKGATFYFTLG